jgi:hypothetical protein
LLKYGGSRFDNLNLSHLPEEHHVRIRSIHAIITADLKRAPCRLFSDFSDTRCCSVCKYSMWRTGFCQAVQPIMQKWHLLCCCTRVGDQRLCSDWFVAQAADRIPLRGLIGCEASFLFCFASNFLNAHTRIKPGPLWNQISRIAQTQTLAAGAETGIPNKAWG